MHCIIIGGRWNSSDEFKEVSFKIEQQPETRSVLCIVHVTDSSYYLTCRNPAVSNRIEAAGRGKGYSEREGMGRVELLLLLLTLGSMGLTNVESASTEVPFTLPSNCTKKCGNINIEYPFGIGKGCYRRGFNLSCTNNTNQPPRLILGDGKLEVTRIDLDNGTVSIMTPIITMGVDEELINVTLIDLHNWPYSLKSLDLQNYYARYTYNLLYVSGCSVIAADLVDLTTNKTVTNRTIGTCITRCTSNDNNQCKLNLYYWNSISLEVRLTRLNQSDLNSLNASMKGTSSEVETALSWYIKDYPTCEEAKKNMKTYACLSRNSDCYDILNYDYTNYNFGYFCQCSVNYQGNPYLPNGCQDTNFTLYPVNGCPSKCGTVNIPFPFGLKKGCYRDRAFSLTCNETSSPPTLLFQDDYRVRNISLENGQLEIEYEHTEPYSFTIEASPFIYVDEPPIVSWVIEDQRCKDAQSNRTMFACVDEHSSCLDINTTTRDGQNILGYRCNCSKGYEGNPYLRNGCTDKTFKQSLPNQCSTKCGDVDIFFPFGVEEGCYRDQSFFLICNRTTEPHTLFFQDDYIVMNISLEEGILEVKRKNYDLCVFFTYENQPFIGFKELFILNWIITDQSCNDAELNMTTFACVDQHSSCKDENISSNGQKISGYRCQCNDGYEGNPYLLNGCTDIDECSFPDKYVCYGTCTNTMGSYNCTCPPGSYGDPRQKACIPDKQKTLVLGVIIGVSNGVGLLLLSTSLIILRRKWKKRKQKRIREKYFRQNHGLLLQQLISSREDAAERTKIFPLVEIEKATNNFDETRVLGRGGHGTVYKGILSDQRVVAIKKSKIVKKSEIDQFVNEVAILSQINHRNVVKLFGCCLETEVPLLIYEFISNGALSDHLHTSDGSSALSWEARLRIATETAGALAYLHSAASISILHRDVKSSNILLDDHFTAKVSDFGASRFIPLDQTHIVTGIQGTFGYLDPEYYQTSQLTEKSDVYSFGVILLELLTGKKPIFSIEHENKQNLSMYFLQALKEKRYFDLVEDRVMKEGTKQELMEVIQLVATCLKFKGSERPPMKEVEYKLQSLRRIRKNGGRHIAEGNEEIECLLSDSSYTFSDSVDQTTEGTSRIYSLEKEFMWSHYNPR
ncbi:unnamed protein product [Musa textilis]